MLVLFCASALIARQAVKTHTYCKSRKYTCRYGGRDREGKPFVTGLAGLEDMVLKDLYDAICDEFPPPPPPPSPLAMERSLHTFVVEDKASHFLARGEQLDVVEAYINGDASEEQQLPFVVVGKVGIGKTSLLSMACMPYVGHRRRSVFLFLFLFCFASFCVVVYVLRVVRPCTSSSCVRCVCSVVWRLLAHWKLLQVLARP